MADWLDELMPGSGFTGRETASYFATQIEGMLARPSTLGIRNHVTLDSVRLFLEHVAAQQGGEGDRD